MVLFTKLKGLLIVILLFGAFQVSAQNENELWTLEECLDYALENNINLKRSRLNMQSSEVEFNQSRYNLLPSVNANSSYGFNWGRSIDPTTNQFLTRRIEFASAGANANLTLFSGMQLINSVRQSEHELHASTFDVEATKNQVMLNIIQLYTNVIFNKELLENSKAQLANTNQELLRVTKQVEVGALAKADQLDLEAQQATNELDVIQQENNLAFSLLQLKQALQLPSDQPFDVIVPEELDTEILTEPMPDYSADEIYDIASESLPEFKAAKERIEAADVSVRIARGGFYPSLNLTAGLRTNYSDAAGQRFVPDNTVNEEVVQGLRTAQSGEQIVRAVPGGSFEAVDFTEQFDENLSRSLSVGLNIPIFNNFNQRSNLQRAQINQQSAELTLEETKNTVRQDIETAHNDVIAAAKSYAAARKQVDAREEAFRMIDKRYKAGAASLIEYQLSENRLFQARSDLLRSKYDYIFRMKILDFYLGNPLDF